MSFYLRSIFMSRDWLLFYVFSLFFIVLNLFTLDWLVLPGEGDVDMIDPAVNFVLSGEWYTTAWYGDKSNGVYSLYPPLYQYISIPWLYIFGVSLTSARSLNIFIMFFLSLVIFIFMKRRRLLNSYTLVLFLLLFWGGNLISESYRNGRVEALNMLLSITFLLGCLSDIKKWVLVLLSFLIIVSGIQACMYVFGMLVCICVLGYFKLFKVQSICFLFGSFLGLLFMCILFYSQGHLLMFFYRSFQHSASFANIITTLLPYLGGIKYFDNFVDIISSSALISVPSFFQRLLEAYIECTEYVVLCVANIFIYLFLLFKNKVRFNSLETRLLFIALVVPLFMSVFGRLVPHYTWMCYIPAVFFILFIVIRYAECMQIKVFAGILAVLVFMSGLPKSLMLSDKERYSNVVAFIEKHKFTSDTKIVSPFTSYFPIRNCTPYCYFVGNYPLDIVPEDTRYVITTDNDFGCERIDLYLERCKLRGKNIYAVDSILNPKLVLYLVE